MTESDPRETPPPLARFTLLGDTDAASCDSDSGVCELPAEPAAASPQPAKTSIS